MRLAIFMICLVLHVPDVLVFPLGKAYSLNLLSNSFESQEILFQIFLKSMQAFCFQSGKPELVQECVSHHDKLPI